MAKKTLRDRVADIASAADGLLADVDSLKEELQNWYDNMPEGIQNGDKGNAVQEVIDTLDTLYDALSEATGMEATW